MFIKLFRGVNTCPIRIPAKDHIKLTENEAFLFCNLKKCIPDAVLRVAGGWVRDKLLGKESNDIDIALDKYKGIEAAKIVKNSMNDCSTIGIIATNPDASKHLETACIRIFGFEVDFVNLRTDTYADTRIPNIVLFIQKIGTPYEDAHRRDLTINALFYNINEDVIEDWTLKGLSDLYDKIARTPLPAFETLMDDPLRALRVFRFATRFSLVLEKELEKALENESVKDALIKKVSKERIGIEYVKMIKGNNPIGAIKLLQKFGYFANIFEVPDFRIDDSLMKTLESLEDLEYPLEQYTALILSSLKSHTIQLPKKPVLLTQIICSDRLKLCQKEVKLIQIYLKNHQTLINLCESQDISQTALLILELKFY